jgi:two-component system nitrogen regulation sensor histidine kinase NtrY
MKSLRVRLSLAFVLVAWLPMAVVGVLAQRGIEARTRESYARQLDARAEAGRRLLAGRASDMSATLARLCAHDLLVDRVMLDLARGHFMGPEQAELERLLPPLMESVGFDALLLFDARGADRGRVLGAGHYPSLAGARDVALLQELERSGDEPFVTTLRVRDGREPARDEQAWVTGCAVERDGVRVALLGGAFLDAERASRWFGEDSAVRAVLVRPGDALPSEVRDGGGQASVFTFRSASGEERYELLAAIDDADLEAQLAGLLQQNLLTAGVAALLALLFATLVAVRLSRPLRELEDAATRIGAGDLELAIDERGGGEVGRTFSAFNHMTRELKSAQKRLRRAERIAAWRDIARRIAHEIKNPLSPIQVSIETMRKTYAKKHPDFDEIFEESTLTILEEVERMKRIVGEFSEFARMPRPRLDSVDLVRVAEQVTTLHAHDDVPPELRVEGAIPAWCAPTASRWRRCWSTWCRTRATRRSRATACAAAWCAWCCAPTAKGCWCPSWTTAPASRSTSATRSSSPTTPPSPRARASVSPSCSASWKTTAASSSWVRASTAARASACSSRSAGRPWTRASRRPTPRCPS